MRAPNPYDSNRDRPFPLAGRAPRAARFDGKRRFAVEIGCDPIGVRPPPLEGFLLGGGRQEPLSLKATLGFLSRTRRAKLRFEPGFIEAVENHLVRLGGVPPPKVGDRQLRLLAA
jgi:DNA (cytosine-5)-methyltransferase 1